MIKKVVLIIILLISTVNLIAQSLEQADIKKELTAILDKNYICLGGANVDNDINISTKYIVIKINSTSDNTKYFASVKQTCIIQKIASDESSRKKINKEIKLEVRYIDGAIQSVYSTENNNYKLKVYPRFNF